MGYNLLVQLILKQFVMSGILQIQTNKNISLKRREYFMKQTYFYR